MTLKLSSRYKPHDYQENFLTHAMDAIENRPSDWHLYSSPTGTGKSIMQLALMDRLPKGLLITPRLEIINGMLEKCDVDTSTLTEKEAIELAAASGIYTPIRLRNILAQGKLPFEPSYLQVDECHHDLAQSYQDITMYLNGIPKIGLTATPFRGTPKGTRSFLSQWNDTVNTVLSVCQAIEHGYCSLPTPTVWNLLDDDKLKIVAGDFDSKQLDDTLIDLVNPIVARAKQFYLYVSDHELAWDRPTMFSVPSVRTAKLLHSAFELANIPTNVITGETSYNARQNSFSRCVNRTHALIQVNVVSEGVDLPIRRLIDCAPTISPVKWMQQIGRIMRPTENPPEYYTICRNLERHCYLMEGAFPSSKVVEIQQAFDKFKPSSKNSTLRVLGTENLTRYTVTPVKLKNGITVFTYHLNYQTKYSRDEYYVIVHPNSQELVCGKKESTINTDTNEIAWGKWRLIKELPPVDGFTSVKKKDELSEKQLAFWNRMAEAKGLDIQQTVNNRAFQIVPFLLDVGMKL